MAGTIVALSPEVIARARAEAERDHARATRNGWNIVGHECPQRLEGRIGSYCAEEAVPRSLKGDMRKIFRENAKR